MIRLNIHQAKTHLSKYLPRLAKGETIILCKRNVPIAEIRPIQQPKPVKRVIGSARGQFTIPPEFFEPLPDEILEAFYGRKDLSRNNVASRSGPLADARGSESASEPRGL
ncbi:MAG: type II toxin-antitoxin system Phd/YefM family antitoxin [Acidobacteria bacterium]|nr:type II toxin-antitoxin system Phd/YefM family antitoxin [Acidobacteriota bacterium]